ncbi:DHHC palmitoyltransferase-domain-containing protein [Spinellus fusiger]|nr:DHHC palmitoyltransferase-domain-containing protein [Spinellus fusiger]
MEMSFGEQVTPTPTPTPTLIRVCFCLDTGSAVYSKCWPLVFLVSALLDIPCPLPKGKKPGQHRDWGWLPILVVLAIAAWMYYGYLVHINFVLLQMGQTTQVILQLVIFHLLLLLFLISYGRIVSQLPGHPKNMDEKPDTLFSPSQWCDVCRVWKPDRTHHCRVCDRCVLKMDHHCPWVNGCVGLENYRYFIQMIVYTSSGSGWVFITTLASFIQFNSLSTFDRTALSVLILACILMFFIGLFTCTHLWLTALNRTTLENIVSREWGVTRKNTTDLPLPPVPFTSTGQNIYFESVSKSWTQVMGSSVLLWFLPLNSPHLSQQDGIHFSYNSAVLADYSKEMAKVAATATATPIDTTAPC